MKCSCSGDRELEKIDGKVHRKQSHEVACTSEGFDAEDYQPCIDGSGGKTGEVLKEGGNEQIEELKIILMINFWRANRGGVEGGRY
jgi:hypothetical protein